MIIKYGISHISDAPLTYRWRGAHSWTSEFRGQGSEITRSEGRKIAF